MKKSNMFFTLLICAILIISSFGKANAEKVLVNIWDGTEWTKIEPLFHEGKLPNAESVGRLFTLTCNTKCFPPCMETSTKPQHATMLTGYLADVHGVFSNRNYHLIPDGLTVYERIELLDSAIKTAHISSKRGNFGRPTFGNIVEDVNKFVARDMDP